MTKKLYFTEKKGKPWAQVYEICCPITFKEVETLIVLQLQWLLVNSCLLLYSKAVGGSFLSLLQIAGFLLVFENYPSSCCGFLVRLDLK